MGLPPFLYILVENLYLSGRCGTHSDRLLRWEHPKGKPLPVSLRSTTLPKGEGIAFPSGEGGTAIAVTEEAVFLKEGGKGTQQLWNCPTN